MKEKLPHIQLNFPQSKKQIDFLQRQIYSPKKFFFGGKNLHYYKFVVQMNKKVQMYKSTHFPVVFPDPVISQLLALLRVSASL